MLRGRFLIYNITELMLNMRFSGTTFVIIIMQAVNVFLVLTTLYEPMKEIGIYRQTDTL